MFRWMQRETTSLLTLGGLLCLTVVVLMASGQLTALDARMATVIELKEVTTMQTLTEVVTVSETRTITVSTVRNEGESTADWIARHNEAVTALQDG